MGLHEQMSDACRKRDGPRQDIVEFMKEKLRTLFIGNIASFEHSFGELWGHGKKYDELTDDEIREERIWSGVRNQILTSGNNTLRAILSRLHEEYKV